MPSLDSVWARGGSLAFGLFHHQRTGPDRVGFQADAAGVEIGLDRLVGCRTLLGFGIGYASTGIRFEGSRGQGDLDNLRFGPYFSWSDGGWFLDASTTYGYHRHQVDRNVDIGILRETAQGTYDGHDGSIYLGGGRDYLVGATLFSPTLSLQYIYLSQNSFEEAGAAGANLALLANDLHSMRSKIGIRLSRSLCAGCTTVAPEAFGGWAHEYLGNDSINARFAEGSTPFATDPGSMLRDSGYFGAGLTTARGPLVSAFCRYHGELSGGGDFHSVNAGLVLDY